MKKVVIIIQLMAIFLVGCFSVDTLKSSNRKGEYDEITIVITDYGYKKTDYYKGVLKEYIHDFAKQNGIEVRFYIINAADSYSYEKKLSSILHNKDGPTLLLVPLGSEYKKFIDRGIALNVKDRIPNLNKIYEGLLAEPDYFVPFGMSYLPMALNKEVFEELGIKEPIFDNWKKEDYLKIRKMWLEKNPEIYTFQYFSLLDYKLHDLDILDSSNKVIKLDNDKVKKCLKDIRAEIFSGRYILEKDYTYENFYKMHFEKSSKEYKKAIQKVINNAEKRLWGSYIWYNPLKTFYRDEEIDIQNKIILPNVVDNSPLKVEGFIVNKNGKNQEMGIKFINGLLDDEIQLKMYSDKSSQYPVNKEIERLIDELERDNYSSTKLVSIRKYVLKQLRLGKIRPLSDYDVLYKNIIENLYKDLFKVIFADKPYTDEEMSKELQKIESKYNMWLNE
ncbi:extracellular solute-binding protein [Caloranaerobacter azorensis]|uniref:ABC transporter substrate-binding protein n=1 Tax=Caloranaerobacter azorensis TaxID=116090 RepID=A0A6P1YCZ5_9FIRM|nr:extracellular solute-binding protein [Caloranaerobacter azorensis]QIB27004.1 ABC transporter substrate-binding protein [Caloranaerobacter azorensis]